MSHDEGGHVCNGVAPRVDGLAYALSTVTLDLSLAGEAKRWGHLSPASCEVLAQFVRHWIAQQAA